VKVDSDEARANKSYEILCTLNRGASSMCVGSEVENSILACETEGVYSADMGYKEDLQRVHQKIDDLAKQLPGQ